MPKNIDALINQSLANTEPTLNLSELIKANAFPPVPKTKPSRYINLNPSIGSFELSGPSTDGAYYGTEGVPLYNRSLDDRITTYSDEDRGLLSKLTSHLGSAIGKYAMAPINGIKDILDLIVKHEGGLANQENDKGGLTNVGITKNSLAEFKGIKPSQVTDDDIRSVTPDLARKIFHANYIEKPGLSQVKDLTILNQLSDMSVLHGPANAVKLLQRSLKAKGYNVADDGKMGPATVKALNDAIKKYGTNDLNNTLVNSRVGFVKGIVKNDPTQAKFLDGWLNRANKYLIKA